MFYDRRGNPISLPEWAFKLTDYDYRHIARDEVDGYVVSTLWLGIDRRLIGAGAPLIFETAILADCPHGMPEIVYLHCYAAEMAARAGHDQAVAWVREYAGKEA